MNDSDNRINIVSVYTFPIAEKVVILAKAGIHCFQYVLDPPVKPEDDKYLLYTQTLNSLQGYCFLY